MQELFYSLRCQHNAYLTILSNSTRQLCVTSTYRMSPSTNAVNVLEPPRFLRRVATAPNRLCKSACAGSWRPLATCFNQPPDARSSFSTSTQYSDCSSLIDMLFLQDGIGEETADHAVAAPPRDREHAWWHLKHTRDSPNTGDARRASLDYHALTSRRRLIKIETPYATWLELRCGQPLIYSRMSCMLESQKSIQCVSATILHFLG
jgi:hypothetical protein